ncbi:MAG TPA: metallophosphoesterase family protein [Terriglobia bacterium]|nr:metallophosphoesterase family protein [Terriglobia bacterium]
MTRLALFGGIYSNYRALEAALADVRRRGIDAAYCLGDLGAFGPYPDRIYPLLRAHRVQCIQGNYDNSLAGDLADCQCGYTDPRDNHFARISYSYTFKNTSEENKSWLGTLPMSLRIEIGGRRVLLCHGSPRKMNEFLWESTSPDSFLEYLLDESHADIVCATHTGIKWRRALSRNRHFINVGVLGRPENDGKTDVWYTVLAIGAGRVEVEFVPVPYDHQGLAADMRAEGLPGEFIETITTGWWTTCLEVLPHKERARGRY